MRQLIAPMPTEAEAAFVKEMRIFVAQGVDFTKVAKDALLMSLGESPSETMASMIGSSGMGNPGIFAAELQRLFGKGAEALFESVRKCAAECLATQASTTTLLTFNQLVQDIKERDDQDVTAPVGTVFMRLLHDFRNEDGGADDNEDFR